MPRQKYTKQKTLLAFFGQGSPDRSESAGPSNPGTPQKTRLSRKAKGKSPAKPNKRISSDIDHDYEGGSTSSDVGAIGFEPKVITVTSSDEEDNPLVPPRSPKSPRKKIRRRRAESIDGSTASKLTDSDPEPIGVPIRRRKDGASAGKRKQTVEDDSDEEEPQPRRRKLTKGVRPPTPEGDLMDEVDSEKIVESRLRTRGKKSQYLQNLEKLRRRKLKQPEPESEGSEEEEEEEENDEPIPGAKPHNSDAEEDEEEDEGLSGFIEEDSNNAIAQLPMEYSMSTYQDLMHHFKIICQLFVHLAVQDEKDRRSFMEQSLEDEYFSVPLQIARRKLMGMRDSVASSVWKPAFKKPLETFPDFEAVHMDFGSPGCDACNLGGRTSTIVGRVSGEPYDKLTYEPLDKESSSEDSDDENEGKMKKQFDLGRFCARRTHVFHMLTHWEYSLYKSLSQEVNDLSDRSAKRRVFVPVAYSGGKKPPKNLKDADGIMTWLDERGVIEAEWLRIKQMMESTTNLDRTGEDVD